MIRPNFPVPFPEYGKQKAKGKRQKAKGKRQKAKGKNRILLFSPFCF
jgi:hypothetical protein